MPRKCVECDEYKNCRDSFNSWLFFIIGLVATVAIRGVTILMHVSHFYSKLAWYIGVGGFFIFFIYKFRVSVARTRVINRHNLTEKINRQQQLSPEDYNLIGTLLCAFSSNKERINYLFIFGLSALALAFAVYIDFFK